jgi:hypothetical protein
VEPRQRYDDLADFLAFRHDFVELRQMMGMPCIKARGKIAAGFWRAEDAMVFKLADADERERALALDGAHLFDPSGKGQPFREWVVVPAAHADEWEALADHAVSITPAG